MGIYLNPGYKNFSDTIRARIFVDKTMMIPVINRFIDEDNRYICVSRPRRFGKTIAGNMLAAYYSKGCDSHELFSCFKVASAPSFESKINKYNVIQIDVNGSYQISQNKEDFIKELTEDIKMELQTEFPDVAIGGNDSLARSILKVYMATGETFIIIMDEYDVLVREKAGQRLFDEYLSSSGRFISIPYRHTACYQRQDTI